MWPFVKNKPPERMKGRFTSRAACSCGITVESPGAFVCPGCGKPLTYEHGHWEFDFSLNANLAYREAPDFLQPNAVWVPIDWSLSKESDS